MKTIITAGAMLVAVSLLGVWALPGPNATGISGVWTFDIRLPTGRGRATFGFEQDGETLRGAYRGSYGTADVTGTVRGDHIEFTFDTPRTGLIAFTGAIHGTTMDGSCDYGAEVGVGAWTAERGGGRF